MGTEKWIDIGKACEIFGLDRHHYEQYLDLDEKPTRDGQTRMIDVIEALDNRACNRAGRELYG